MLQHPDAPLNLSCATMMQGISPSSVMKTLDHAKNIISGKNGKLKKILKSLEKITEEGSQFLLLLERTIGSGTNGNGISNPANTSIRSTTSSPTQIIIGRDKERDEIVRMLRDTGDEPKSWIIWAMGLKNYGLRLVFTMLSLIWAKIGWAITGLGPRLDPARSEATGDCEQSCRNSKCCYSVISIYGIAGSGKTTLAQNVCSYEKINNYFFPVMWIYVSPSFSVDKIYQKMLEAATGKPSSEFSNLDTLQMKLEAELTGKRFLLVLDDIWHEKDAIAQDKLNQLLSPLKVGKKGSKVLVTTRFKDVAMSLSSQRIIPVPNFNEEDFFNLFMHYALDDAVSLDGQERETFYTIGREIARKLKGSPLAARIVGSRLRKHLDVTVWTRVGDQHLLTDTMGALWWSYQHLNVQLRRCFAYCSMFPQGYDFKRDELVDLWMAEGFIKTTDSAEQMDVVCQSYFDELVSCSFLQPKDIFGSKNKWFTMHDLLHELAAMVAGTDCFRVESGDMKEIPPDVRHLFIRSNDQTKFAEKICKLKKLRTLILITTFGGLGITIEELEAMLKKLKKLRVVHVDVQGQMVSIPGCICELKHLRFLRIHSPWSEKVNLPKKLDTTYHLQILELCGAGVLDFSNVQNMSHLISLRDIRNSGFVFPNTDVPGFPGIGELKSLRELSDFRVRKDKGYELKQLKSINHLRGRLRISGLESVESKEDALEAKLTDKKFLTSLSLEWSQFSSVQHSCPPDLQVEILEGLCPPSQLTELEIQQYNGLRCPSWLSSENQNGIFTNLQDLQLCRCYNLDHLPEIGKLFVSLRQLKLVVFPKLKRMPRLPGTLKNLHIQQCKALVMTCSEDVNMIRSLFVETATQIEPSLNITATEVAEIERFAGEQPDRFEKILCDIFSRCGSLPGELIRGHIREEDYSELTLPATVVDRLIISYCFVTNTVLHRCLTGSANLVSLNLRCLPFLTEIPSEVMESMAKLSDLSIEDCIQFTHLEGLNNLSRLQHLTIAKCPNLRALGEDQKVRSLNGLAIDDIPLVPQLLSREGCSSLWSLRIDESEQLRGGDILEQLTSLTSLDFSCCSWDRLPENLVNLTSLENLRLDCCKKIQSLPELPASLQSFEVEDCDALFMKSCQKAGDQNCQKIAHVPVKRFSS
jgi:hypothetical protein